MGRSLRHIVTGAASAALVALGSPGAASAAQASEVVNPPVGSSPGGGPNIGGFSARALTPKGELSPQTYFTLDLPPGGDYSGQILVTNSGEKRMKLRVYSVDGLTGNTSGTVYANRDDPRKETSTWIDPGRDILGVKGEDTRTLNFTVHVPADATPGDHVGAIAMEAKTAPKSSGQFAVREIIRVAVAVQIRVSGPASAALKLGPMKLEALGGTQMPSITTQLANTGQLLCRPALSIALSRGDQELGTIKRQLDTILAGDTIPYPLGWPKPLAAGTYDAIATTSGCGASQTERASLVLKDSLNGSQENPGTEVSGSGGGGGVPWWALVLVAVAALGGGFLLARRRPKRDDDARADHAPAASSR